ncbi:MAG: hypothetical protein QOH12_1712 [Solirubrobacteraceae bacterium]|jgi:hypothetical protein|nr:hypothetical protein [Solirubrobacteraceae bacterium]
MSSAIVETRPVEELALFNPAFLALMLHRAVEEHESRSAGRPMPSVLSYLIAPVALHGPTRRALPINVRSQMGEWVRSHPEASLGLGNRARARRPLVSDGLRLGLQHGLLSTDGPGMRSSRLPRRPRGMARTTEVDKCIEKAGFLGRWFSEQPDSITTLALWGLRP